MKKVVPYSQASIRASRELCIHRRALVRESAILCCRAWGSSGSTKALTMWFVKETFIARSDTYLIILLKQAWSTTGENGDGTTVVAN